MQGGLPAAPADLLSHQHQPPGLSEQVIPSHSGYSCVLAPARTWFAQRSCVWAGEVRFELLAQEWEQDSGRTKEIEAKGSPEALALHFRL